VFTGIVEQVGEVTEVAAGVVRVRAGQGVDDARLGESVALARIVHEGWSGRGVVAAGDWQLGVMWETREMLVAGALRACGGGPVGPALQGRLWRIYITGRAPSRCQAVTSSWRQGQPLGRCKRVRRAWRVMRAATCSRR
jgi:hypothetical protein